WRYTSRTSGRQGVTRNGKQRRVDGLFGGIGRSNGRVGRIGFCGALDQPRQNLSARGRYGAGGRNHSVFGQRTGWIAGCIDSPRNAIAAGAVAIDTVVPHLARAYGHTNPRLRETK